MYSKEEIYNMLKEGKDKNDIYAELRKTLEQDINDARRKYDVEQKAKEEEKAASTKKKEIKDEIKSLVKEYCILNKIKDKNADEMAEVIINSIDRTVAEIKKTESIWYKILNY